MEKNLTSTELAEKALALLNESDKLEQEKEWERLITIYQQAIEYLKLSGLLSHRIEDIYERITEIKKYLKPDEDSQKKDETIEINQLQDQAFAILEGAEKLEVENHFEDALRQYMEAIKLLVNAGWTETQLDKLQSKILNLSVKIDNQREIDEQTYTAGEFQPQISETYENQAINQKTARLKALEEKKENEEQTQITAFKMLDDAKIFEKEKKFDEAINKYENAIQLLESIGWTQQTVNLRAGIEKLRIDRDNYEKIEAQKRQDMRAPELYKTKPLGIQTKDELKKQQIIELETIKKEEEDVQTRAFNLIEIGKRLDREKQFEEAIGTFLEAIDLLKSISWDAHIQPIENFIIDIMEKQKREKEVEGDKKKREYDLTELQKTIKEKQEEPFIPSSVESDSQRRQFEQGKIKQLHEENLFFRVLNGADKILQTGGDIGKALEQYEDAFDMIGDLGVGGQSYKTTIQATIESVKQRKIQIAEKEEIIKKQQVEQKKKEKKFQIDIADQIRKERAKLKAKQTKLRGKEEEKKYRENQKQRAFQFLETGEKYLKEKELDKAIYSYQNAGDIFAEIQWTDELPIIEKSIKEIEKKKNELKLLKQNEMKKAIEKQKSEKEFQTSIAEQMRIEREKLKQKKIKLKERDQEVEYREQRKQEAFKMMDEAQNQVKEGKFDKAIDIYHETANVFAEIQWHDETDFIQNSIIEIENKKKEAQLQKQKDLQKILEKEHLESIFQEEHSKEMKTQVKELEKKETDVKEKEIRKTEASNLIGEALTLLKEGNYEEVITKYQQVELILNEIQFPTDIVKDAILKVQEMKNAQEIAKQNELEKQSKKNEEELLFKEQLAEKMKTERQKMESKQIEIRKQEVLKEYMEKRKSDAFSLIEEAELFMNQAQYDKALEFYRSGELILNEIHYSTDIIKNMISKVQDKKKEEDLLKQKEIESQIRREKEEREFRDRITDSLEEEKEKLKTRKLRIEKEEELKALLEKRSEEAFEVLDKAQDYTKNMEYDNAIENYRKAELLLNEIHYSTDSIKGMISKVNALKEEKTKVKELELQSELENMEEEKQLTSLIEERKRQEEDHRMAQKLALQEREKFIQEQKTHREAADKLLEEAGKFLKSNIPDYEKSISLYIQARDILAEKVGWEHEINNLNSMITGLQQEKAELLERQKSEAQKQLKHQQEYDLFQEEIRKQQAIHEKQMEDQKLKLKSFEERMKHEENLRDQGFNLIDEGKKFAKFKEYKRAYANFEEAITLFKTIGWGDQIHLIETEIKNTKLLEENERQEELKIQGIQEDIQKTLRKELQQKKEEVGGVTEVVDEISKMISARDAPFTLNQKDREEQIKIEAKEFSKHIGRMLNLKQELSSELKKTKELDQKKTDN